MKKYIALFAVLTLALAVSPALARIDVNVTDADDMIMNLETEMKNRFEVEHNATAFLTFETDVDINTGGNALVASDDLDAGTLGSGEASLIFTENSVVNDVEVDYTASDNGSGADIDLTGDDLDDGIFHFEEEQDNEEEIESNVTLFETNEADFEVNTGGNAAVAEYGDAGEDSPIVVSSGPVHADIFRGIIRNSVKVTRN